MRRLWLRQIGAAAMMQGAVKASSSLAPMSCRRDVTAALVDTRRLLPPDEAREYIGNNWSITADCRLPNLLGYEHSGVA